MPTRVSDAPRPRTAAAPWTFLTNHAHVLLVLADDPERRLRDVAARVGITERSVQLIVADLERGGVLTRTREGRRNRYDIHAGCSLRHPVEAHRDVRALLALALPLPPAGDPAPSARPASTARGPRTGRRPPPPGRTPRVPAGRRAAP